MNWHMSKKSIDLKIREIVIIKSAVFRFRALGIDRAVENAELQDKLEKAQNELRRAQVLGTCYDGIWINW